MNVMMRKRSDDMPMTAAIVREGKGKYVVMIKFTKSRRHYSDEYVFAKDLKAVKAHMLRLYPALKFSRERKPAKRRKLKA